MEGVVEVGGGWRGECEREGMNWMPSRTRFRKACKGRIGRLETRTVGLHFGSYGLQILERARISGAQLEAVRRVMMRRMQRTGKVWFRVFPHKPVTAKPLEVRMGKGKGSVDHWVAEVRPGRILVELEGVSPTVALHALSGGRSKLPCLSRILKRPPLTTGV